MELFEMVFKPETLFETLFLDIKVVAEYPTSDEFRDNDSDLHDSWIDIANVKYGNHDNRIYHSKAVNFPEFSKISTITIGLLDKGDNDTPVRTLETISGVDEKERIEKLFNILEGMYKSGMKKYICGHGISSHHIPFLVKRGLKHGLPIPKLFKIALTSKPWDSKLIDTSLIWRFNSIGFNSLDLIADFLDLKTNVTLRKPDVISGYHYNSKEDDKWLDKQSINETNLLIQILRKIRES